jgi:hypothetical protein
MILKDRRTMQCDARSAAAFVSHALGERESELAWGSNRSGESIKPPLVKAHAAGSCSSGEGGTGVPLLSR